MNPRLNTEGPFMDENSFLLAAENSSDGILIVTDTGKNVYANKAIADISGYGTYELLVGYLNELVNPWDTSTITRDLVRNETSLVQKNGNIIPVEVTLTATRWHSKPAHMLTIRDNSTQSNEPAHAEVGGDFRSIAEDAPLPMVLVRLRDGLVFHANDLYARAFGVARRRLIGTDSWETVYDRDQGQVSWDEYNKRGRNLKRELCLIRPDGGRFWVETWGKAVVFDGERAVFAAINDITSRKLMEEGLVRQRIGEDCGLVFDSGDLMIDFDRHKVTLGGREVDLTETEYGLLTCLSRSAGSVVEASQLIEEVWGQSDAGERNMLEVYINRLRQKLGDAARQPRYIVTKRGVGYLLVRGRLSSRLGS